MMKVQAPPRKTSFTEVFQRVYSNLGSVSSNSDSSSSSSSSSSSDSYNCNNLQKLKYYIQESDDDFEEEDGTMELVQIGAERAKNVLILMSDTGGGHRASAEAIRDAFKLEYGDEYRIIVKDVWKEYTGWPLNDMERQYKFMVKHVQLWKVAFHSTSPRWIHSCYLAAIAAYYAKEVEAGLMEYKPDIIISVHPMMQHIPLWVLKWQGLQKKVIFVTVITDLNSCHPTWFHPRVNRCYCPSEEVAKRAALDGLEDSQIRVFGLPIRPSFARAVLSKDELREELELDPSLPAVLLMGGGEGMGPVKKTALALGESLFDKELGKPLGQLIIICGRNKVLKSTLESHEWTIPVKVRGFETQMEKWMGACDCIITKAGPGTIAEALIRGLPIILNDYIPGQEKGNVPYVVDNGAGVFTRSPKETAKIVTEWFCTKTDELERMSENALKLAQPEAVFDIIKDIHELAQARGPLVNIPYVLTASFTSII
ncbi:monogalactosyldiacylglycerol synthase 2, chloroplastic [Populus alba]|uniref:monogalactosyldiacylglycerol synthase 2, chloroplastic n=1 Tax=Populus alba TaxID=43335 RepID=UPI00158F668C|nr:monogalactosyldiacylglycerol synthase 2, chloroplastic-like [Populus alba]XP_034893261.1 monogalactosyldiacylglycerol synthase 2, chloroplastic-like [Populus alba]